MPHDGPVGDADDRLVHEVELAQLDGQAQVVLELDPLRHLRAHGLVEHRHRVAPGVLGLVHGGVGVADESLGVGAGIVARREGQADAGRHVELHPVDDERRPKAVAQAVGQVEGLGHAHHLAEDDHELVAADAGHEVRGPHVLVQPLGHVHQQLVAVGVAERVVDQLEAVEVEEEQGDVGVVDGGLLEHAGQVLLHHPAVGQPRQAVVHRLVCQVRLGALGDVEGLDDPDHGCDGQEDDDGTAPPGPAASSKDVAG